MLFAEQDASRSAAANVYREIVEREGKVSQVMQAFRTFLGEEYNKGKSRDIKSLQPEPPQPADLTWPR